jgi:protein SCO1/2
LRAVLALTFALIWAGAAGAAQHAPAAPASGAEPFDRDAALALSQAAIGRSVGELRFTGTDGKPRRLSDYRGKPLVISLIYTSCYHICPTTTKSLARVVRNARTLLGDDGFTVLTLGFDSQRDTPEAMQRFASEQGVNDPNWDFVAADEASARALAAELGFQFRAAGGGFDHLLQTTVIDQQGLVRRQIYGMDIEPPLLVEPLKRLVYGEELTQSWLQDIGNRFRLYCTVYDPASDSYRFSYAIFVGLAMGVVMGIFFIVLLVREWRYSRSAGGVQAP